MLALRPTSARLMLGSGVVSQSPDFKDRRMHIRKEVGTWLYSKKSFDRFTQWCEKHHVKARSNVKITTTNEHARCLRATKELFPGQAIITAPLSSSMNFLTVTKQMFQVPNSFPVQCNWMNWNERLRHLPGAAMHELVLAGWLSRAVSQGQQTDMDPGLVSQMMNLEHRHNVNEDDEEGSGSSRGREPQGVVTPRKRNSHCDLDDEDPFEDYARWLVQDTSGREGAVGGIGKERGDMNPALDDIFMSMANDAGEEPDVYMEHFFRLVAAVALRTQPIDARAVEALLPGTNFFKAKASDLFVPTFVPLVDCVPHVDDFSHNVMLDFFLPADFETTSASPVPTARQPPSEELLADLCLTAAEVTHAMLHATAAKGTPQGMFALRAIRYIEAGEVLTIRGWPKTPEADNEKVTGHIMEQSRMMNNLKAM